MLPVYAREDKGFEENSVLSVFNTITIIFILLMKKMRQREKQVTCSKSHRKSEAELGFKFSSKATPEFSTAPSSSST